MTAYREPTPKPSHATSTMSRGTRRVHDGGEIVSPLVDDCALPVRDRVRETHPAPVEDDHTAERTQAVEQTGESGLLLEQLERDQPTRHHHDVAVRPGGLVRIEHPVPDVRPIGGSGVEDVDHDLESRTAGTGGLSG